MRTSNMHVPCGVNTAFDKVWRVGAWRWLRITTCPVFKVVVGWVKIPNTTGGGSVGYHENLVFQILCRTKYQDLCEG